MTIELEGAKYNPLKSANQITLIGKPEQMCKFFEEFVPSTYTITRKGKKRSNDANAYAWLLISKLADKMHLDPVEVYRDQLTCVSDIDTPILISKDALESFTNLFVGDHIGRQVIVTDSSDDDHVYVMCRKGSSDFDTKRMSVLIENLVQDCKTLGIETEDEGYIKSLLEEWK